MWTFTKCFIQNKYDFHKSLDLFLNIKDTLKAFDDFKCKQKTVWITAFWDVKVCIFWNCIQYIIYWDKTQTLKKFLSDKINGTKIFFRELQLITALLLICDSYMSWSTRFVSLKRYVGLSIFDLFFYLFIIFILFSI